MNAFDEKVLEYFPGKVVRKDLTSLMKKGANVPTYVLEYLLGMYCATDDEEAIEVGLQKIRRILSENYVRPDQSEYVKSKIKENGQHTIIDKITVVFDEREDKYVARFTNLRLDPFEVPSDLVVHNEKLLVGGIWCIVKIEYVGLNADDEGQEEFEEDIFGNQKRKKKIKKKKSKYDSPFVISSLKPIQMPNLDLDEMKHALSLPVMSGSFFCSAPLVMSRMNCPRKRSSIICFALCRSLKRTTTWLSLVPAALANRMCTATSPYSILMSSGTTTVSNMFYNMSSRRVGLVGMWDCIAFDEVAGITQASGDMVQIMKNYMANGSFARGADSISSDASIAFEGNTFRSVADMMRTTNLFEPFPVAFNNDSAFFDRIHAYLPGWETPKLRSALFTTGYGLISDCFSEFCHAMRKYDFTNSFSAYFTLNKCFNTRDTIAVGRTFSGLAKLIHPDERMTKEEVREILEYAIECRRRVKEQLRKMTPGEFSDVDLGYIDDETGEEIIVELPEVSGGTLIRQGFEKPGYVYGVGRSVTNVLGIYRLENKLVSGTGHVQLPEC